MRPNRFVPALFLAFLGLMPQSAQAAMMFCNRTHNPIEAALGYRESTNWVSEGWWRIEAKQCARVLGSPLTQRFYFYYARSLAPAIKNKTPLTWTGKYELCTDAQAFRIEGDDDCKSRNFIALRFQEVDIGAHTRDYTLDFKDESAER